MRILILGGGGREHALAWRLSRDPDVREVLCAPGNPGIAQAARLVSVDILDPVELLQVAAKEQVDLTVVGPESPLDRGVADAFASAGMALFGPVRAAAQLECSKVFSKRFMAGHGIPTARFAVCETFEQAINAVSGDQFGFPVVVKADGLAAGKGVIVAADRAEAEAAVRAMMEDRQFGAAGSTLVIEECLTGPEVSFFVLADGRRAIPIGHAQDHKRVFDDDRGPNTGGMGAFAPSPLVTPALGDRVMREIVEPVLAGMRADGHAYRGFLYVSLMLTPDGPKVIEFNVRFGDPEAQVVLPAIEGPLARTLLAAANGDLGDATLSISRDCLVGVVLASAGYPAGVETGRRIDGLDRAATHQEVVIFHAGTALTSQGLVTAGGRVLTVVGRGVSYDTAMQRAYAAVHAISFDGMQYRKDIGMKAITPVRQ
jgi:phosphoribosylamine--glycine ligase